MAINPKSRLLLVCGLVYLLLASGCVGIKNLKMGTVINANGSGKRVIDFSIDKKLVAQIEKEDGTSFENQLKEEFPAGTRIQKSNRNNFSYYTTTTTFKKLNDGPHPFRVLLKNNGHAHASLVKEDKIFAVCYDLIEEIGLKKDPFRQVLPNSVDINANSLEIQYWIQMPGEIRETSGTPVLLNKAVWKIKSGRTYKIRTKSLLIRWWLIALTGIAVLLLIGFLGILIINRRAAREQAS